MNVDTFSSILEFCRPRERRVISTVSVDGNSSYKKNAERLSLHEMSALVRARRELWRELWANQYPGFGNRCDRYWGRFYRDTPVNMRIHRYIQYQFRNMFWDMKDLRLFMEEIMLWELRWMDMSDMYTQYIRDDRHGIPATRHEKRMYTLWTDNRRYQFGRCGGW